MLLIVGVVAVLIAVVLIPRVRSAGSDTAAIGWMSEQWLAEHRMSHSA